MIMELIRQILPKWVMMNITNNVIEFTKDNKIVKWLVIERNKLVFNNRYLCEVTLSETEKKTIDKISNFGILFIYDTTWKNYIFKYNWERNIEIKEFATIELVGNILLNKFFSNKDIYNLFPFI